MKRLSKEGFSREFNLMPGVLFLSRATHFSHLNRGDRLTHRRPCRCAVASHIAMARLTHWACHWAQAMNHHRRALTKLNHSSLRTRQWAHHGLRGTADALHLCHWGGLCSFAHWKERRRLHRGARWIHRHAVLTYRNTPFNGLSPANAAVKGSNKMLGSLG